VTEDASTIEVSGAGVTLHPPRRRAAWLWLLVLFTLGSYVWFLSPSFLPEPQGKTMYYDLLAQGFLAGTPFLAIEPDARLANLTNPYSPGEREGIPYLHDASYFRGKYSLYFGPAPGAIVALLRLLSGAGLRDDWLTFLGIAASYAASCLILLSLKKDLFPDVPFMPFAAAIAVAGFANPMLWTLNYPAYNTAAIAWGAAFLLVGTYVALPGLEGRETPMWRPILASFLWGCSLGSRLSLGPGLLVLIGVLAWRVARLPWQQLGQRLGRAAAALLPFFVAVALLGAYNFVRFGSAAETGFRYALTGTDFTAFSRTFAPEYVPFNLFNYLAKRPGASSTFPYLDADLGRRSLPWLGGAPSTMHAPEQIAGVLLTTPYAWLAGLALALLLVKRRPPALGHRASGAGRSAAGLLAALSLGFVLNLAPLLLFFYSSMRYILDFSPLLVIIAGIGSWVAYRASTGQGFARKALAIAVMAAALLSVLEGWLLALSDSPALALWRSILG